MSDTPRTDAYVEFWLKDRLAPGQTSLETWSVKSTN